MLSLCHEMVLGEKIRIRDPVFPKIRESRFWREIIKHFCTNLWIFMRKIANIIVLIDSNISSEAEGQIHFQKHKNFKNSWQVFFLHPIFEDTICSITYWVLNYYPCDLHQNTVTTIPWENCNLSGEEITCKLRRMVG